jgi:F-type H+-transporting ATPase subunit delta
LGREPRLRRALADPAREGADRAALLDGIVANSVSADTRAVLGVVAGGRWSRATELLDGVEGLGVDALLRSADSAGKLGDVEDELFRFGQIVDGTPELAAVLADTTADASQRATVVAALLAGKANPITVRLITLALGNYGGRTFSGALTHLVEATTEFRDRQVAYVTVATALTEAEEQRLGARLAQIYGREMALKVTVDPSVIGGLRVLVGSDLYDGTTVRRLADARHALSGR